MPKKSQRKGRAGELELAAVLREYGFPGVEAGAPCNHGMTPDLVGLPGIHVECKRREKLDLPGALAQSIEDSEKFGDGLPVVIHRKNRQDWLVSLRLSDFMEIYRHWKTPAVSD